MALVILYYFLIAIMIVGIIGELLPAIPGMSLILIAMVVWGFVTKFAGMGVALTVAFVVLLLSIGVEFLASYLGAQKVGASNWSQIGLVVGLLAGIFGLLPALPIGGPIIGLFVGPVVGAFVGEYAYRRDLELTPRLQQSLKVCVGIVVGTVIGHVAKAMLATAAVIVFIVTTWPNLSSVISYQLSVFSYQFSDLSSLFFN
ncbi:MAG: DUF456 domain-containing protein [Microcystis sp.]|uniref:DUF456 domain-containing protein n=1 Tax=Microcystis sp. TaxID=1127 RepID=UPI00391CE8FA